MWEPVCPTCRCCGTSHTWMSWFAGLGRPVWDISQLGRDCFELCLSGSKPHDMTPSPNFEECLAQLSLDGPECLIGPSRVDRKCTPTYQPCNSIPMESWSHLHLHFISIIPHFKIFIIPRRFNNSLINLIWPWTPLFNSMYLHKLELLI